MYQSLIQYCTDNPLVKDFNYSFVSNKCVFAIKPNDVIGTKTIICNYIDMLGQFTVFMQDLIIVVFE